VESVAVKALPHPSETTAEAMARTYDTNVFGVIRVTNAMLPCLRESHAARIVNVGSEIGSLHYLAKELADAHERRHHQPGLVRHPASISPRQ
jgi:NADP-dependent 3-hydroxy acid dehydrogenase YdfG